MTRHQKPRRAPIDGASVRRQLIAAGVLREGTGVALTRAISQPLEKWRVDDASHASAAVEIFCTEKARAVDLRRSTSRVSPRLISELDWLGAREMSGLPVIFVPREQWLREAMAPEPDAVAS